MRLLELWSKYQHSGINGSPVITDTELNLLSEKLSELEEFLNQNNPARFGVLLHLDGVNRTIFNRNNF